MQVGWVSTIIRKEEQGWLTHVPCPRSIFGIVQSSEVASAHPKDVIFYFPSQTGTRGMKVEQSPSSLSLQEGISCTLRCNFSVTVQNVQWFRQNPGGGLVNLFFIASGIKENGKLRATVNSKEKYSILNITASQLQDSATYFCAAEHSTPMSATA